jgi:hypothetical protein
MKSKLFLVIIIGLFISTTFLYADENQSPITIVGDFQKHNLTLSDTLFFNIFENDVFFYNSIFKNDVRFNSEFDGDADFADLKTNHEINFSYSKFKNNAYLTHLQLDSNAKFQFFRSTLPYLIDFSYNSEIHHNINFTNANFDDDKRYSDATAGWHFINLFVTSMHKVRIDYQHFRLCFFSEDTDLELSESNKVIIKKDPILLKDSVFFGDNHYTLTDFKGLLKINALKKYLKSVFPSASINDPIIEKYLNYCFNLGHFPRRLTKDETISIYESVLKSFEANGQTESYESLDIEYHYFKEGWFHLPYLWYCYGYHKEWIFFYTLGFLLLFTFITWPLYQVLNQSFEDSVGNGTYYIKNIPLVTLQPDENIWFYRFRVLTNSLWYTSTIFLMFSLELKYFNFKSRWAWYIIIIYSTGLICIGYLANFILQK